MKKNAISCLAVLGLCLLFASCAKKHRHATCPPGTYMFVQGTFDGDTSMYQCADTNNLKLGPVNVPTSNDTVASFKLVTSKYMTKKDTEEDMLEEMCAGTPAVYLKNADGSIKANK